MSEDSSLPVTFSPELSLQRQGAILEVLRRERVSRVLDVGCGDGALLSCLAEPTQVARACADDKRLAIETDVYLEQLVGLDLDEWSLRHAADDLRRRAAAECETEPASRFHVSHRWDPLHVQLWRGSLADVNPAFVGAFDAIVAQEVIEHLPPEVLPRFAPVLLGIYRPRTLIITTPSFDFNERFSRPGAVDRKGYKDPTGRTERIFRHHDHKLEWTRIEFASYCHTEAALFGYTAEIFGIGRPLEPDPFAAERVTADLGAATQVAVFTRIYDGHSAMHSSPLMPLNSVHSLYLDYRLDPRPTSSSLGGAKEIHAAVQEHLVRNNEGSCRLHSLWYQSSVATLCSGNFGHLLDVLEDISIQDESWSVASRAGGLVTLDAEVVWHTFVATPEADRNQSTDNWEIGSIRSRSTSPASSNRQYSDDNEQDGSAGLVRPDTIPDLQPEVSDAAGGWVNLTTENWAWGDAGAHHDWVATSSGGWNSETTVATGDLAESTPT